MKQEMMTIVDQIQLAPDIYEMTLKGALVNQMSVPGQFLHIRIPSADLLMRRPISIHEIDQTTKTCKMIYRVEGQGTAQLAKLTTGTLDVLGPLGNGFSIDDLNAGQTAYIIGGGIGIPPLYELSKQLVKKGITVYHLFGFASKTVSYHLDKFAQLGKTRVATDDGSLGEAGLISVLFDSLPTCPDAVFSCGNNGLLKAVEQQYGTLTDVQLSLEARMACGVGACYACVCPKQDNPQKSVKVCDEGPIFKAGVVQL